jgi:hypothetical protein
MFEFESLYMLWHVCPNMVMFVLQDLIKLYKNLNVTIHHQWESLYINPNFQTHICDNSSSNNFDFDN